MVSCYTPHISTRTVLKSNFIGLSGFTSWKSKKTQSIFDVIFPLMKFCDFMKEVRENYPDVWYYACKKHHGKFSMQIVRLSAVQNLITSNLHVIMNLGEEMIKFMFYQNRYIKSHVISCLLMCDFKTLNHKVLELLEIWDHHFWLSLVRRWHKTVSNQLKVLLLSLDGNLKISKVLLL